MCVSSYEKKRLGLVNKPVIMALKANVHEIAQTYCTAYPNAKVLYPGNRISHLQNEPAFSMK